MANPEHLAKLREGVGAWNVWRDANRKTEVDLSDALLQGADLREADLRLVDFSGADLTQAQINRANLYRAKLSKAQLGHAILDSATLGDADLRETSLRQAFLTGSDLNGADLTGADLSEATLRDADLRHANLTAAKLVEAHLSGADFTWASLIKANLLGAKLDSTKLRWATLRGSLLVRADLREADLSHATLEGCDLEGARLGFTTFGWNDLRNAKGLDALEHEGPSSIGFDTILQSKGIIPEKFLRGCGVPDELIALARSLVTSPIQFYSCFISYSTKDQDFADRLYADLQNKGVRCWFAPHDVQGGRKLHEQIDEAIRLHDKLLLILSPHSMESEWVKTEIAKARKREVRDRRRVLFPIRLAPFETLRDWECFDADTGKDSAREIREYFIPDFSNWKDHDSYQEAFQRLISDLKASDTRPK